jgi:DNA-binding MarR family transcriptional regulator
MNDRAIEESSESPLRGELAAALANALREASGQGVLYSQAVSARLGINSTDLECLDVILTRATASAGEIAKAMGLTTGAVTTVIDRLERAGFARRETDPADRRKVLVRATPAVMEQIAPLFEPMERAASNALESYSEDELRFLLEFLDRMRKAATLAMVELGAAKRS